MSIQLSKYSIVRTIYIYTYILYRSLNLFVRGPKDGVIPQLVTFTPTGAGEGEELRPFELSHLAFSVSRNPRKNTTGLIFDGELVMLALMDCSFVILLFVNI